MESALIIDDDVELCVMLRDYFQLRGIRLEMQHEGEAGLASARRNAVDIVILDVMLPRLNGFEVLRRLRTVSNANVMLLTARGEDKDRIDGLEAGADDYLPKPFNPRELLARMRAIHRRASMRRRTSASEESPALLRLGAFEADLTARTVSYNRDSLDLTDIEFQLLETFLQSPGIVFEREQLVERILERPFHPLDRSLDMHISRLRRKLQAVVCDGWQIKTVRSAGYLFAPGHY
jgi:two-component system, OmpR family, response regulator CpxR